MEETERGAGTRPDITTQEPWLTIKAASLLFTEQKLPRNERSIRRYCLKNKLDCKQIENDNRQFEHRVRRGSLIEFIKEHKTLAATSGHVRTGPGIAEHDRVAIQTQSGDHGHPDNAGHGSPSVSEPVLINLLKEQLDRKDKQIETLNKTVTSMVDRDRETNILIGRMQEQLSLTSGKAEEGAPKMEPEAAHTEQREVDNSTVEEGDQ